MPCEKCWNDAFKKSQESHLSQPEWYSILMQQRNNNPCTPEQQAGVDAKLCPVCKKRTIHPYTKMCMNPNCKIKQK